MDQLDREVLRRGGLGADVLSALAGLVALGHEPAVEVQTQLGDVVEASRVSVRLASLGWAPCGLLPVGDYVKAGRVLDGQGVGASDEFVADAWAESGMLPSVLARVAALGAGVDRAIEVISAHRADLVNVAWRCHAEGAFDASIPIVLAQVEGICFDASGKAFFSKDPNKRADVTDAVTLAGLETALGATRDALSGDVRRSAATGRLERHGIAHGREVAYGSHVNSWKCWVLLLAVWEWANQRLRERHERRARDAEARWAGSDESDDEGRRRDRRGFMEARLALRDLAISQMGFHRAFGRFATVRELDRHLPGMGDRSVVHVVEAGEDRWWAWSRSASGWVFAIGVDSDPGQWRYRDGADPPSGSPSGTGWATEEPPNWRGDTVPGHDDPLPD